MAPPEQEPLLYTVTQHITWEYSKFWAFQNVVCHFCTYFCTIDRCFVKKLNKDGLNIYLNRRYDLILKR